MEQSPQFPVKKDGPSRMVPVSELKEGQCLIVYGEPKPLIIKQKQTQSDGSIKLFLEGGTMLSADTLSEEFEVAPSAQP